MKFFNEVFNDGSFMIPNDLSDLEIKLKLGEYINKLGLQLNDFEQMIIKITDDITAINEENNTLISEKTKELLVKWLSDGTISKLVKEALSKKFVNKDTPVMECLSSRRIFRVINDTEKNMATTSGTICYATPQGFTRLKNGNMIIAYMPSDNAHIYDNTVKLVEYSPLGEQLRSGIFDGCHANSLSINERLGEIYLAKCFKRTENGNVNVLEIMTIDYDTFTEVCSTAVQGGCSCVAYDKATNKMYYGGGRGMFETDSNFTTIKKEINLTIEQDFATNTTQSQCVYNGYIYKIVYNPNLLLVYDLNGDIVKKYTLPHYIEHMFYVGECEDLEVDDNGDIYILCSHWNCNDTNLLITSVFKINLSKGVTERLIPTIPTNYFNLYVGYGHVNNPTGRSTADSFDTIGEAIEIIKANPRHAYQVNICKDSIQPFIYVSGLSNVRFECNGCVINGFRMVLCNSVQVNNCTLKVEHKTWKYPLSLSRCYGIKLNDVLIPYISTLDQAMPIDSTTVEISGAESCSDWSSKGKPYTEAKYNCSIVCSHDIENIYPITFSGTVNPSFLRISKVGQTCNTVGSNIELTEIVKAQGLSKFLSRYRCIVFTVLTGLGGRQTFKLSLKNTAGFNITYDNVFDNGSGFSIVEIHIDINNGNLKVTRGRTVGFNGEVITNENFGAITDVYLTNEL